MIVSSTSYLLHQNVVGRTVRKATRNQRDGHVGHRINRGGPITVTEDVEQLPLSVRDVKADGARCSVSDRRHLCLPGSHYVNRGTVVVYSEALYRIGERRGSSISCTANLHYAHFVVERIKTSNRCRHGIASRLPCTDTAVGIDSRIVKQAVDNPGP